MSATGRGAMRRANDAYATPAWAVDRFLEAVHLPGGIWLEPCAGDGAIVRAVLAKRADVRFDAVELRSECIDALKTIDGVVLVGQGSFLDYVPAGVFSAIITNPPYSLAEAFVRRAVTMAPFAAFLLRLNWLEGAKRSKWLREHMPDVYVLPNRPGYMGNGKTDATAYAWMLFFGEAVRTYGTVRILADTPRAERKAQTTREMTPHCAATADSVAADGHAATGALPTWNVAGMPVSVRYTR